MELATSIAQYEEGQCHVVHAWELFGNSVMKSKLRPKEYEDLVKKTEDEVATVFDKLPAL